MREGQVAEARSVLAVSVRAPATQADKAGGSKTELAVEGILRQAPKRGSKQLGNEGRMALAEQNEILGQILIHMGRITVQQLDTALSQAKQMAPLGRLLSDSHQVSEDLALEVIQDQIRLAEGEVLVRLGAITRQEVETAMFAAKNNQPLGVILVKKGLLSVAQIRQLAQIYSSRPWPDLVGQDFDPIFLEVLPRAVTARYRLIPVARIADRLIVGTPLAADINALDDICVVSGYKAVPIEVSEEVFENFWAAADRKQFNPQRAIGSLPGADVTVEPQEKVETLDATSVDEAPIIQLVNEILGDAISAGVSDIHIEPKEKYLLVRYRKDGLLGDTVRVPKAMQNSVLARTKIMSNLNVSERRIPQDGRVRVRISDRQVDLRVSSMPTQYGEKIVIRILNSAASLRSVDELGLTSKQREDLLYILGSPQGILFVTGPTGSGKSTTLYSALGHVQSRAKNIITIEDPIEYTFEHATQVQVNPTIDLTFARVLRTVLRQDPDIVLIGEIRDHETAKIALEAAMTGHMVLTSLHANDATATITRLEDMGCEHYLIGTAVLGAVAQRLVRQVCSGCRQSYRASAESLEQLGLPPETSLFRGDGCDACRGSGYLGRRAVYEVLPISETARDLIFKGAAANAIRQQAQKEGMASMRQHAQQLVLEGQTTFEEFMRVVYSENVRQATCPRCRNAVEQDFSTCPFCQLRLSPTCPSCRFAIKMEWAVCPKCATALSDFKRCCRACNSELEPKWLRCPYCADSETLGTPVD